MGLTIATTLALTLFIIDSDPHLLGDHIFWLFCTGMLAMISVMIGCSFGSKMDTEARDNMKKVSESGNMCNRTS